VSAPHTNGLRLAADADIPEIVRVINAAYRVEDFFIDGNRTDRHSVHLRMQEAGSAFLVAEDHEAARMAGAVYVRAIDASGYFGMLSVDPACQGRGFGRALVEAAEEYCRQRGCRAVSIDLVNLRSELPAFYQRLGYVEGKRVPFPDEWKVRPAARGTVHMTIMTKALDSGGGA
jgi:GNAT superfamily N-acetyltransferase